MRITKLVITTLALTLLFAACSNGDEKTSDAPTTTAGGGGTKDPGSGEEGPVTTTPDELFTTSTIEPGFAPVPGSIDSVRVEDLSVDCTAALKPIRDLQDEFASGLQFEAPQNDIFNSSMDAARAACDQEEFARFQRDELAGFMNAVPTQD